MKRILMILGILLLSMAIASANGDHQTIAEKGKELVDSGISCDKLTNEQLETIGGYFMEQMHPGEAHEIMDKMMGGEGSESLKQMHINMAKRLYCNEDVDGMMDSGGMIGMMPTVNTVGGGMMNGQIPQAGMMGNWGYSYFGFTNLLYIILLIGLIILVYLWIVRLLKNKR